ncbi:MAG: luciferase family protein [Pseudomonadota bacterium]
MTGAPAQLRSDLEERLVALDGISIAPWKDTQLITVRFRGKEFAHFHGDDILDIRLSQKIIREEQLSRDVSLKIHPNRSKNSIWIGVAFTNEAEVDHLVHLVKLSCASLG